MLKLSLVVAAFAASFYVNAGEIYKCDIGGEVTYSHIPCETGENVKQERLYQLEAIKPLSPTPSAPPSRDNQAPTQNHKDKVTENQYAVKLHLINSKIKMSEKEIDRYQRKMRGELKTIKNKTYYAANNNAGANYLNALSNEMQAVSDKYKIYIDTEREKIKDLKQQIETLRD